MKKLTITLASLFIFLFTQAQNASEKNNNKNLVATYSGGDIILSYNFNADKKVDSIAVKIYRKDAKRDILLKQQTIIAANKKWQFADTSIRKNPGIYTYKIVAYAGNVLVREDDVTAYAFAPDVRPLATKFKASNNRGTNSILLSWKIENKIVLKSVRLLRSRSKEGEYLPVAELKYTDTTYTDMVDDANEPFFYVLDMASAADGKTYTSASVFVIPDFKIMPAKVTQVSATQKGKNIVVNWLNSDVKARGFYVTKRSDSKSDFTIASTIITSNRSNSYTWEDTATNLLPGIMYQYAIIAESNSFDKSQPSDTASILYKNAAQKLSPPQNLTIITANDTLYNLAWTIDSARKSEPAGYVVFIKKAKERDFKMMEGSMALADINYIQIPKPSDGDTYKVQAVNGDEQSVFSIPFTYNNAFENEFGPVNLKASVLDDALMLKWMAYTEMPIKEYRLYKFNGKSFELIETIAADKNSVTTKKYTAGQLNMYQLRTVKSDNTESNGSKILQVN